MAVEHHAGLHDRLVAANHLARARRPQGALAISASSSPPPTRGIWVTGCWVAKAAPAPLELEAGSYSLYAIPGETEWTIVANTNTNRWGIPISPDVRASDVGSTLVRPTQAGDHVETLTFTFRGSGTSGILTYAFERTTFDLEISRR